MSGLRIRCNQELFVCKM